MLARLQGPVAVQGRPLRILNKVDGVGTIESTVARGKSSKATATWSYRLSLADSSGISLNPTTPPVRCDRNLKGYATSVGCVVPGVTPVLAYSRTGAYPQLARHIGDAQNSGWKANIPRARR